jgi:hypothetical protein
MQRLTPMPDFDLDSPEERGTRFVMPDGKAVYGASESQFYRNCLRSFHKARKEGKVIGPPNADLLKRWREDDPRPGSDGSPSWASRVAQGRVN